VLATGKTLNGGSARRFPGPSSGHATDGAGPGGSYVCLMERKQRVLLDMRAGVLRDLLRTDLEFMGFEVRADHEPSADVVITDDGSRRRGRSLTVRLGTEISVQGPTGTWWFPGNDISRLGDVLRVELGRTRVAA